MKEREENKQEDACWMVLWIGQIRVLWSRQSGAS